MRNSQKLSRVNGVLVLLVVVSLISACSGGQGEAQSNSLEAGSAGMLSAASHPEKQIAKQSESNAGVELNQAALKKSVPAEQFAAAVEQSPTAIASGENTTAPSAPIVAAQAPAQPAVDQSIPAEPKVGFRAPDFTLQTTSGEAIQLSSLLGRPVVINYWTTWCVPCKGELPILEQLHREYQQQGLVVLTVNAIDQDSLENIQVLSSELGMTFPILLDQGGNFASNYQAIFFPTTYFIDANGVIQEIALGDSTEEELRASMDKLMGGL